VDAASNLGIALQDHGPTLVPQTGARGDFDSSFIGKVFDL
jgi:hypothetical protein